MFAGARNSFDRIFYPELWVSKDAGETWELRAELPHIALKGTGAFDLLSQDFKATVKASLSPELEQLDHACRVSKRLTAIDWPVNCKGKVGTDPAKWCGVDTEEILEDLAKNEGKRRIEKEAGKLLDKLFK